MFCEKCEIPWPPLLIDRLLGSQRSQAGWDERLLTCSFVHYDLDHTFFGA